MIRLLPTVLNVYFFPLKFIFSSLLLRIHYSLIPEPVTDVEVTPIFPPQSGEKQPDDPMRFFLEALLEYMVTQVSLSYSADISIQTLLQCKNKT